MKPKTKLELEQRLARAERELAETAQELEATRDVGASHLNAYNALYKEHAALEEEHKALTKCHGHLVAALSSLALNER